MITFLRQILWVFLLPVSFVWALVSSQKRRRCFSKAEPVGVPVISVGNLTVGGTGKTPLVIEIATYFRHKNPVILSRGYRAKLGSHISQKVDLSQPDGPIAFGDEPYLLAQKTLCPVYIGKNRLASAKLALKESSPGLFILDDGFSHFSLKKNADIVLLAIDVSPEDIFCLPLGDYREPVSALSQASLIITTGNHNSAYYSLWLKTLSEIASKVPVLASERQFLGLNQELTEKKFGAFCGIAKPSGFQKMLSDLGQCEFFLPLPDHYAYPQRKIDFILEKCHEHQVKQLVTTEKDWVKIKDRFPKDISLHCVRIRDVLPQDFWYLLDKSLNHS